MTDDDKCDIIITRKLLDRSRPLYSVAYIDHIVLDLDGTLISEFDSDGDLSPSGFVPVARPHLANFLKFVFDNCSSVNIWTRASRNWWDACYQCVIKKHMPDGKTFHRVWCDDKCKRDGTGLIFKPLSKYWRRKWQMKRHNTVIVDNDPLNYFYDQGNGMPIQTYWGCPKDDALLRLKNDLVVKMMYDNI